MSIENLLEQLRSLDKNQQQEFLDSIQDLINEHYIDKKKVAELQKEMNILITENNLARQQALAKFSRKEHQTIAYQLGKSIIDTFNGQKPISALPKFGLNLFIESIARKDKENLNNFQEKAYFLLEYSDVFKNKNLKTGLATLFKKLSETLDDQQKTCIEVEGECRQLLKPELKQSNSRTAIKFIKQAIPYTVIQELQQSSKKGARLKIACIMDEFTYFCFSPEAELLQISPENWLEEISQFDPDILFIESAWQSKDGIWKTKVSQNSTEVISLIKFCKMNAIKTLFWNKEDPVHFGTFIDVAKQVDVVFTTDIDCIGHYKAHVGHERVYLLPFAAQPKTHNPIEKYERKDAFNFAGSFYLKYPERQLDFVNLTHVATKFRDLEIYDRNYNKPHPHYTFPKQYQQYILGCLEPDEIDKAYKGYVYGINMNTIKQSQSMFARRVFEMLASNTIVLSNYSRGVRNFFGDLVLCSDNPKELENKLNQIVHDKNTVDKFKLMGLRKVLAEHTYEDRLEYILQKLKIKNESHKTNVVVVTQVDTLDQWLAVLKSFNEQTYSDKALYVYNPKQLNIDIEKNVYLFADIEQLVTQIQVNKFTHLTFFNSENAYTADYLLDQMLSFKYLKHTEIGCVTKDTYYKFDQQMLCLQQGKEYVEVSQVLLDRSVFTTESVADLFSLINSYLQNSAMLCPYKAMAIDRFNFIANGQSCDAAILSTVIANMPNLDTGVKLKQDLLPYAENIGVASPEVDQTYEFGIDYFKKKPVESKHKAIVIESDENSVNIVSKLAEKDFKYIFLLKEIANTCEQISLYVDLAAQTDAQCAIEFYDIQHNKIGFETLNIKQLHQITLPHATHYFNVSLRIKGAGKVKVQKVTYTVHAKPQNNVTDASLVNLGADVFATQLVKGASKQIQFESQNEHFIIKTTLAPAKHAYMYMKKIFTREELNLVLNSQFEFFAQSTAEEVRIVFEFQDANQQKISHSMNSIVGGHALAIPMECVYVRIGLKIMGSGITEINKLSLGVVKNPINHFIAKSKTLVVAKQYPSYSDLYKYGFLHTRLRSYKEHNKLTDMFRVTISSQEYGFSEFDGIDVFSHNHEMLDKLLASGRYEKVCIHLIDQKIWDVVKKYQDKLQILVWVHGAEIQVWQRREFEFENFSDTEIVRQKKLSDQRRHFWRNLILDELHQNTQFIFVSQYFLNESEEDLGVSFPKDQVHIIHNYIDTNFFNYVKKPAEQRFKLLSIRPFASRTYANDLTVKAIVELSKKPNFDKFEIAIYGDGKLFDEVTAPLSKFNNVKLYKKFLNHSEISKLHKDYGVFIVPTRMDSQGVSRDEAMASGLVPVTTAVAAIPEFVDNNCGILVEGENYHAMADEIYELSKNINKFHKLSWAAANRVNEQSGYEKTILKELQLVN